MKLLIFGYGAMGRRRSFFSMMHVPGCKFIVSDPYLVNPPPSPIPDDYIPDWRAALDSHSDADAAFICSPFGAHLEQMQALVDAGVPFLVEKPPCAIEEVDQLADVVRAVRARNLACAVGFSYHFHPAAKQWPGWRGGNFVSRSAGNLRIILRDDLLGRYGRTALETVGPHAFDIAMQVQGQIVSVDAKTDGVYVQGTLTHPDGKTFIDQRIDHGPRVSELVYGDGETPYYQQLHGTEFMYERETSQFLDFVRYSEQQELADLRYGYDVMAAMRMVRRV